jgi:hypothetical protein
MPNGEVNMEGGVLMPILFSLIVLLELTLV